MARVTRLEEKLVPVVAGVELLDHTHIQLLGYARGDYVCVVEEVFQLYGSYMREYLME